VPLAHCSPTQCAAPISQRCVNCCTSRPRSARHPDTVIETRPAFICRHCGSPMIVIDSLTRGAAFRPPPRAEAGHERDGSSTSEPTVAFAATRRTSGRPFKQNGAVSIAQRRRLAVGQRSQF